MLNRHEEREPRLHLALVLALGLATLLIMVGTAWLYLRPAPDDVLQCAVPNLAWTVLDQLLRGGRPTLAGMRCLAAAGVGVLVDQRTPAEARPWYAPQARLLGLEYLNLGIPDDSAPSPDMLRTWLETVRARLEVGELVLVHDAAGRGRMGFWEAVYHMSESGLSPQAAIDGYYLGTALPFKGARIGCQNGGNGQVQALAEIAEILSGQPYLPDVDEYGTRWEDCPRPAYMDGWDYDRAFQEAS